MPRLHLGHFQQWNVRLYRFQTGTTALHVQLAARTQLQSSLGQPLGFAQITQRVTRHRNPLLRAAQLEVVACNFCCHHHLRIGQVVTLGTQVGTRGFSRTALPAEQIQFPTSIEAKLIGFTGNAFATQQCVRLLAPVLAAAGSDVRQLIQTLLGEHRTCSAYAGHGDLQIQVLSQCIVHQPPQDRIIELCPPTGHRRHIGERGICRALQGHLLDWCHLVIRTNAHAAGQQGAGHCRYQHAHHHGSTSPR